MTRPEHAFPFAAVFCLALALAAGRPALADPGHAAPIGEDALKLPIFDAHMHYKHDVWDQVSVGNAIELMDRAGVSLALVSSTPDEGTIRLYEYAPRRVVPEARPYHDGWGSTNWTSFDGMIGYLEKRLADHPHVGIGEFHLQRVDATDEKMMRDVARLAAKRGILLHIHADAGPVRKFYEFEPGLTIIWAHAGMNEPPEVVAEMMDAYPTLHADLSYREDEILGADEKVTPRWKPLLIRHADRFMVGSDTWNRQQWADYEFLIERNRAWLMDMPRVEAEKIAYRNAERLFGRKVSRDLIGRR